MAAARGCATAMLAGQVQGQAPDPGGRGGGVQGGAPARGITVNLNVIQKASAKISGEKVSGTIELNEYQVANGGWSRLSTICRGSRPERMAYIACGILEKQRFDSAQGLTFDSKGLTFNNKGPTFDGAGPTIR